METKFIQSEAEGPKGWAVWKITGRVDAMTADDAYALGESIVKKSDKTVLDMSELDYLSSAGLRVLLRLNKLATKSGKKFTVAGPAGMVKTVLEDSSMDALLNARESMDDLE